MQKRVWQIDIMRGVSMILMMVLHVLAYYKQDPVAFAIWEFSQLSVPVFIFCSAYLFYTRDAQTAVYGLLYFKKRFIRLMVPYYWFLVAYGVLLAYFEPSKLTQPYIIDSLILTDGIYINWLVLLFLYISILSPLMMAAYRKSAYLLGAWLVFATTFSALTFSLAWPEWWRWGMWIGWSVLIVYCWYIAHAIVNENRRRMVGSTIVAVLVMSVLALYRTSVGLSLEVTQSKYPPNLYYLAYSALCVPLAWYVSNWSIFATSRLKVVIGYFSRHSYSLFFIHFFVIFLLLYVWPVSQVHWLPYTAVMFGMTLLIQWSVSKLSKTIRFGASK